jgi:hypothetical protein
MENCKMNYWTIQHPPDTFFTENIDSTDTLSLPGIECETCGESWSNARLLPFGANNQIQHIIRQTKCILPRVAFLELKNSISKILKLTKEQSDLLKPGSTFPPVLINTKGATPACYSGHRMFFRKDVIERLRELNLLIGNQLEITDAAHWKCSKTSQLCCVEATLESDLPKGIEISNRCASCGFIHYRKTSDKIQYYSTCHARPVNSESPVHFLRLNPTNFLLISDDVRTTIEEFSPECTQFIPATDIDLSNIAVD